MSLLWLAAAALAGDVYINGIRADVLPVMSMEQVTVRFDAQGNIWIDAPTYRVTVVTPAPAPSPAPTYAPAPAPSPAPAYAPTPAPSPAPSPAPAATSRPASAVPAATWWLVTEDNDSAGHDVEVLVNGVSVRHVRSGEAQLILDLGPWLQRGANTITLQAAPGTYGGGAFTVYVGKGSDAGGTVRLDAPDVRYTRRAVDLASGATRSFTLTVP